MRSIRFHGRSLSAIRSFPLIAKRQVGYQLDRIQRGVNPADWKPLAQVGSGVKEMRIVGKDQFRVVYVVGPDSVVHVLHAFCKKTAKTPASDIRKAREAFKQVTTNHG